MKKLIGLYIFLIFLIALFALFNVNFYPVFLIEMPFTPFVHKLFEGITTFIFILIFLKANKLYSQTQDSRMAIIAGGFLAGIFFNFYHLLSVFGVLYNVLTLENIKQNPALIYLLFVKLIIPISLFIAVFYAKKIPDEKLTNFRLKTYFLYLCIFLSILIWDKFIYSLMPDFIISKILLIEHNLSIIDESLYFLTALFLMDKRLTCGKSIFSVFISGLFILGISELFDINPIILASNEILSHFLKIIGFLFIFLGIDKFQSLPDFKCIKQRILASLACFLILAYLTFSFFISLISEIKLSLYLPYVFIEFLLISAVIGYIITSKFTLPISNIIEVMNKYKPGEASEKIQIISNDEIGKLSEKLNEIFDREWDYSQELLKNKTKIHELLNKEQLLFKITNTIRSSLALDETLSIICDEVAKLFNVQRASIVEFPYKNDLKKWIARREYKTSPDIKGLNDITYDIRTGEYNGITVVEQGQNLVINNLEESDTPDYYKKTYSEMGVKSILSVPVKRQEDRWGLIFLCEYNYYREWKEDEINLLQSIADQIYISIKQSELFEIIKQTAKREILLKKIILAIRSSLDINSTKQTLVTEIGKALNADRVFLVEFDPDTNTPMILDKYSEYLSSSAYLSCVGFDFSSPEVEFFTNIHQQTKSVIVLDVEEFIKEKKLKSTQEEQWLLKMQLKTGVAIPIFYGNKIYGVLAVHYIKEKIYVTDEQTKFIGTLGDQMGIALYQAKLYETVKKQSENERILREILSEIKTSQTLTEVYKYIVAKIANIYDANRAFFVEIPALETENPAIKYQYCKQSGLPNIPESVIQEKCLMTLIETANKEGFAIIRNTEEHDKDNEKLQNFFKSFNVKSVLLVPLIRYNHDIKLLGAIVLCLGRVKDWSEDEIKFIKSITNETVTVVWEIKKRTELEELKNTFILTLTHDLQVPLIGEHKALEFIASRPKDQPIGKFHEIITDILKNNENLTILLKKLLDSYKYESEKQKLNLSLQHISVPINEAIDSLKELADSKQISIETQIEENLPSIIMDSAQIKNVLYTILENSVTYIQQGGYIIVKSTKEKDKIITCIIDNGPGIPYKTRERIFERYAMAMAIERKIGAGLGLYLAKQIIKAHKGKIWYETEIDKGTTFCFTLPIE